MPSPTPVVDALMMDDGLRLSTLWEIERSDGTFFRFTDHDEKIVFDGNTYDPTGGFSSSARQKQADLDTRNLEIVGIIDATIVDHDDLKAGLYREAKITERLVDWRQPWIGPLQINKYFVAETKFTGESWEAKVEGLTRFLEPRVGLIFGRTCRHVLGDSFCTVNLVPLTESGTVSDVTGAGLNDRKTFKATGLTSVTGFHDFGLVKWLTGNNAGISTEVKDSGRQRTGRHRRPAARSSVRHPGRRHVRHRAGMQQDDGQLREQVHELDQLRRVPVHSWKRQNAPDTEGEMTNAEDILVIEDDDGGMEVRKAIVRKARECLGTRYHHQGRVRGVGMDCVGLIVYVAKELGLFDYDDRANYSRIARGGVLCQEMARFMPKWVSPEDAKIGDVLVFWISDRTRRPQHMGIKTDYGLIHTYSDVGRVVEHVLDERWTRRIVRAHRYPGVE